MTLTIVIYDLFLVDVFDYLYDSVINWTKKYH